MKSYLLLLVACFVMISQIGGAMAGQQQARGVRRMDTMDIQLSDGLTVTAANATVHTQIKRGYQGQATFFQPGQGACGWWATNKDKIVALNGQQYQSQHCGHQIRVQNTSNGRSTVVTVQDDCPNCPYGNLDLSPAAFDDLADESQGVASITWDFI